MSWNKAQEISPKVKHLEPSPSKKGKQEKNKIRQQMKVTNQ